MGNSESTPAPVPLKVEVDNNYAWPENLYIETRDMGALAFLIYTWGYVVDVLGNEDDFPKQDNWTPAEIQKVVKDNKKKLQNSKHGSDFKDDSEMYKSLQLLVDRAEQADGKRALTLESYDYEHQTHELAFGVTKDDTNERITLVFRGTDSLAFATNWIANITITKTEEPLSPALTGQLGKIKEASFHTGFWSK
jgi:hypothetical protein